MASKLTQYGYMSDYTDYASQTRLAAANDCGHYPKMVGSPCAYCIDRLIERVREEALRDLTEPTR